MKRNQNAKIRLSRETLHQLSAASLHGAAGGAAISFGCTSLACTSNVISICISCTTPLDTCPPMPTTPATTCA